MTFVQEKQKFHINFAQESESSKERKYQGANVPSQERKYVEMKVPVTKSAMHSGESAREQNSKRAKKPDTPNTTYRLKCTRPNAMWGLFLT